MVLGRGTLKYVLHQINAAFITRHCSIGIFPFRLDSLIKDIKNVDKILGARTNPSDENAHVWI